MLNQIGWSCDVHLNHIWDMHWIKCTGLFSWFLLFSSFNAHYLAYGCFFCTVLCTIDFFDGLFCSIVFCSALLSSVLFPHVQCHFSLHVIFSFVLPIHPSFNGNNFFSLLVSSVFTTLPTTILLYVQAEWFTAKWVRYTVSWRNRCGPVPGQYWPCFRKFPFRGNRSDACVD